MSASRYRRWGFSPLRSRAAAALAVSVAGAATWLAGGAAVGPASAAPLRECSPRRGTIVAVDFAHWGGPIVRGCGVGERSGYALLHAAGFTTAGDAHDGPAIVCRIGDVAFRRGTQYPTPSQESCVQTPPTTAYWAYWIAPAGSDHWSYSPLGAMGDVPRPGEVELWIFGATNVAGTHGTGVPRFSPAALRAHAAAHRRPRRATATTRTTTTTRATSSTRTATTRRISTSSTTTRTARSTTTTRTSSATPHRGPPPRRHTARIRSRRAATSHHPPRRARRAAHRRAAVAITPTRPSTTRAGGAKVVAARPTSRRASAGSATPLIVGAALVLLLCAGAAHAIRQRRREE